MAKIIRSRARKPLAEGPAGSGISNYREDGGLTFRITVDDVRVILTHSERDSIVAQWAESEKEFMK